MMRLIIAIVFTAIFSIVQAQTNNPNYDSVLAEKLGADDYGMKTYIFVLLKSGNKGSDDKAKRSEAFAGHMANIGRLVEEGKLLIAGPMLKNDHDYRGIFILDVDNLEEANELMMTDPAIAAGYLHPEMVPWYGSAAIGEYLEASDKVWKIKP